MDNQLGDTPILREDQKKQFLHNSVAAEMLSASAWMKAEESMDGESGDYIRGFRDGYALCLDMVERLTLLFNTVDGQICSSS